MINEIPELAGKEIVRAEIYSDVMLLELPGSVIVRVRSASEGLRVEVVKETEGAHGLAVRSYPGQFPFSMRG